MELTSLDVLLLSRVVGGGIWGVLTGATRLIAPSTLIVVVTTVVHSFTNNSSAVRRKYKFAFTGEGSETWQDVSLRLSRDRGKTRGNSEIAALDFG